MVRPKGMGRLAAMSLLLAGFAFVGCDDGGGGSGAASASSLTARQSSCDDTSWVAGITELCRGHLVYRDYVYDDYGADDGLPSFPPISTGMLSPAAGDVRYADGAVNTADLVRLELWLDGDVVRVEFELNTLYKPDQTLAAIALDTDDDVSTGGGTWPGLGVRSAGWDELHVFREGDPEKNLITGSFPKPSGSRWKIRAVTAQANGTVMNVAFRGPDEEASAVGLPIGGDFWEDRQAKALGSGSIDAFSAVVDVDDLEHGTTRAAAVEPGFHQRVYTSQFTLPPGEGVSEGGVPGRLGKHGVPCEQLFNYLGKYQPYGIYIPAKEGPHGLQLVLHGCSADHASLINEPGMQQRFGENLNRVLVVPLGRGPTGYYSDISERDVLDVMADVRHHYDVADDQVFSGGYSMGGYGAMRFAMLYPQIFAGAVNWVGFTGNVLNTPLPGNPLADPRASNGALGNVIDFIDNLRNVPIVSLYSGADELVHVTTSLALEARFGASDVVYDFYLHPVAEHLTYGALDDWRKEAAFTKDLKLVHDPARVTYRTDASLDFPEYGIKHDGAYWVSKIRAREEGYADVDVTSHGCGLPEPVFATGADVGVGPVPLLWTRRFRRVVGETPTSSDNRIEAKLANVESFEIYVPGACLDSGPIVYHVETDGPVTITTSSGRSLTLDAPGVFEGAF